MSRKWVKWEGLSIEPPIKGYVNIKCRRDTKETHTFALNESIPADHLRWRHFTENPDGDIIAYRKAI